MRTGVSRGEWQRDVCLSVLFSFVFCFLFPKTPSAFYVSLWLIWCQCFAHCQVASLKSTLYSIHGTICYGFSIINKIGAVESNDCLHDRYCIVYLFTLWSPIYFWLAITHFSHRVGCIFKPPRYDSQQVFTYTLWMNIHTLKWCNACFWRIWAGAGAG